MPESLTLIAHFVCWPAPPAVIVLRSAIAIEKLMAVQLLGNRRRRHAASARRGHGAAGAGRCRPAPGPAVAFSCAAFTLGEGERPGDAAKPDEPARMGLSDVFTLVCVVAGAILFLAGTLGLLRFPDTLSRLHALSKADNLRPRLIVLGLLPQQASLDGRGQARLHLAPGAALGRDREPADPPASPPEGSRRHELVFDIALVAGLIALRCMSSSPATAAARSLPSSPSACCSASAGRGCLRRCRADRGRDRRRPDWHAPCCEPTPISRAKSLPRAKPRAEPRSWLAPAIACGLVTLALGAVVLAFPRRRRASRTRRSRRWRRRPRQSRHRRAAGLPRHRHAAGEDRADPRARRRLVAEPRRRLGRSSQLRPAIIRSRWCFWRGSCRPSVC